MPEKGTALKKSFHRACANYVISKLPSVYSPVAYLGKADRARLRPFHVDTKEFLTVVFCCSLQYLAIEGPSNCFQASNLMYG